MPLSSLATVALDRAYAMPEEAFEPAPAEVRHVEWPTDPWYPLLQNGFTAISASRDPLAPPSARPASLVSRQPTAHSEFTQEELISGERLTLVVRKHAGTPLTREEEARLLLLTERLDGRSRSENFGGEDTARIGRRMADVDAAMRELDRVLNFTPHEGR